MIPSFVLALQPPFWPCENGEVNSVIFVTHGPMLSHWKYQANIIPLQLMQLAFCKEKHGNQ